MTKIRPVLKEYSLTFKFKSFDMIQANCRFNRSPYSSLKQEISITRRLELQDNYERLIPFEYLVSIFKIKSTKSKLDDVTTQGIIVAYIANITKFFIIEGSTGVRIKVRYRLPRKFPDWL